MKSQRIKKNLSGIKKLLHFVAGTALRNKKRDSEADRKKEEKDRLFVLFFVFTFKKKGKTNEEVIIQQRARISVIKHSKNQRGVGEGGTPNDTRTSDDSTEGALISVNILKTWRGLGGGGNLCKHSKISRQPPRIRIEEVMILCKHSNNQGGEGLGGGSPQ